MTTPSFTALPTELLNEIIPYVLPEGFESLALTCKTIYQLCTPFIERHNLLRSQFKRFTYKEYSRYPTLSPFRTSLDLITRIAIEPIVAHYIRDADFSRDGSLHLKSFHPTTDVHRGGPVATLLADSLYLKQAGLDWKEYYALIQEDLKQSLCYSQHAAAFLLTLLPNVCTLALPRGWKPLDKTEKLLHVIVRKTKQSDFPWDRPSLAQVIRFEACGRQQHLSNLNKAIPFLALPHVRAYRGRSCMVMDDDSMALASKDLYLRYAETLETAYLIGSCIDKVAITNFLKRTPRLRRLDYFHWVGDTSGHQDWNIGKFVTTIEREAGSCLEELSIFIYKLSDSIEPRKVSMHGFQRLRKLEVPLEISSGTDHHEKTLKVVFRDRVSKGDSQLSALMKIPLSCTLVAETEQAGMVLVTFTRMAVLENYDKPTKVPGIKFKVVFENILDDLAIWNSSQ